MKPSALIVAAAAFAVLAHLVGGRSDMDGNRSDAAVSARPTAPDGRTAPTRVSTIEGETDLRGAVDLGRMRWRDGHYSVRLEDGRLAVLTLDSGLQRAAAGALERAGARQGAVVVMDIEGDVLALAGRKGNRSTPELATRVWAPAASLFKLATAAALIDSGVAIDTPVCYHGGRRSIEADNLTDDERRDARCDDLAHAMARSENAIFAKLAHRHLDREYLGSAARALGFDRAPDFALFADAGRFALPDRDLEFARASAGFWHSEISPLGAALVAHTVASGGLATKPRIVDPVVVGNERISLNKPSPRRIIAGGLTGTLTEMMIGTTEYGTAREGFYDRQSRPFLPGVLVAGKTGTLTRRSPTYMQFSWFIGFAPADDPRVVIAVLLGNPERWRIRAHTAAREVLAEVF